MRKLLPSLRVRCQPAHKAQPSHTAKIHMFSICASQLIAHFSLHMELTEFMSLPISHSRDDKILVQFHNVPNAEDFRPDVRKRRRPAVRAQAIQVHRPTRAPRTRQPPKMMQIPINWFSMHRDLRKLLRGALSRTGGACSRSRRAVLGKYFRR